MKEDILNYLVFLDLTVALFTNLGLFPIMDHYFFWRFGDAHSVQLFF
jgi:hypothetical protein